MACFHGRSLACSPERVEYGVEYGESLWAVSRLSAGAAGQPQPLLADKHAGRSHPSSFYVTEFLIYSGFGQQVVNIV